eukprot:4391422-Prymnesium_polylepis.1
MHCVDSTVDTCRQPACLCDARCDAARSSRGGATSAENTLRRAGAPAAPGDAASARRRRRALVAAVPAGEAGNVRRLPVEPRARRGLAAAELGASAAAVRGVCAVGALDAFGARQEQREAGADEARGASHGRRKSAASKAHDRGEAAAE